MIFNINEKCRVGQFIAKKSFYTYAEMTSADKRIFTDEPFPKKWTEDEEKKRNES